MGGILLTLESVENIEDSKSKMLWLMSAMSKSLMTCLCLQFVPVSQRGSYKKMSDEGASSVRVAVDCSFEQLMSAKVSCHLNRN